MSNNNPSRFIDVNTFIQAGIDPRTGLPTRLGDACMLKQDIKKNLRILDEQNAIRRYKWFNLPDGIDTIIERLLYYKGQGMFFYMESNDTFYFLPYALDGTIDVYGRYTGVTPLPFNGSASANEKGKERPWITGLIRKPVYNVIMDELKVSDLTDSCVLLSDYSKQISQTVIPRQQLQEPVLDVMSDCIPFLRTALLNATGVQGMRVTSQDEYSNVEAASRAIDRAALEGKKYVPVIGNVDFQSLTEGQVGKSEEFLMSMQSLDNFRLSLYGLDNGGLFQKKSHMLEAEQDMNSGNVGLVYQDGLTLRQNFCDIVNSIWGLGISCEPSECVLGIDSNMDGAICDDQDQSGAFEGTQDMGVANE